MDVSLKTGINYDCIFPHLGGSVDQYLRAKSGPQLSGVEGCMKCARDAFSDAGNPDQRIEVGAGSRAESGDLRGATPAVGRWGRGDAE